MTQSLAAGGPNAFVERGADDRLFLRTADGGRLPVSFHLQAIAWNGNRALALTLRPEHNADGQIDMPVIAHNHGVTAAPSDPSVANLWPGGDAKELHAILDTSADGILVLDDKGLIRSLSRSALALFGVEAEDMIGGDAGVLLPKKAKMISKPIWTGC
nr:PAS domain S-box protein [Marinicella sp. W31]MDC2875805.1 PAS domain S-box protein [Marinicella sp. W31]